MTHLSLWSLWIYAYANLSGHRTCLCISWYSTVPELLTAIHEYTENCFHLHLTNCRRSSLHREGDNSPFVLWALSVITVTSTTPEAQLSGAWLLQLIEDANTPVGGRAKHTNGNPKSFIHNQKETHSAKGRTLPILKTLEVEKCLQGVRGGITL